MLLMCWKRHLKYIVISHKFNILEIIDLSLRNSFCEDSLFEHFKKCEYFLIAGIRLIRLVNTYIRRRRTNSHLLSQTYKKYKNINVFSYTVTHVSESTYLNVLKVIYSDHIEKIWAKLWNEGKNLHLKCIVKLLNQP